MQEGRKNTLEFENSIHWGGEAKVEFYGDMKATRLADSGQVLDRAVALRRQRALWDPEA